MPTYATDFHELIDAKKRDTDMRNGFDIISYSGDGATDLTRAELYVAFYETLFRFSPVRHLESDGITHDTVIAKPDCCYSEMKTEAGDYAVMTRKACSENRSSKFFEVLETFTRNGKLLYAQNIGMMSLTELGTFYDCLEKVAADDSEKRAFVSRFNF